MSTTLDLHDLSSPV